MYFAEYDISGTAWLQVAVAVRHPTAVDDEHAERWWARLRILLRHLDFAPDSSTSLRVHLGTELGATIFVVAPKARAEELRHAVGSLTQLDLLAEADVQFASERSQHDNLLRFPSLVCRAALPTMSGGNAWFAFDFRVHTHLHELLWEAHTFGHALSYHVNIERVAMDVQWQREAARNALRVADIAGVSASLAQLQHHLAAKLRHATHLCEEYLGVETPAAVAWLHSALDGRFQRTYGQHIRPDFQFDDHAYEASLTTTRHKVFFEPVALDEVCGTAITTDERTELLAWQPSAELSHLLPAVLRLDAGRDAAPNNAGMPPAYPGNERFVFVSYSHRDLQRVTPLIVELQESGHRVWYDNGIPGGAEWDAMIEERVQRCEVLLVFVSRAAVDSKFVRREVKFADTLNKRIVAVRLDRDVPLSHGFAMLLNQYQTIEATRRGDLDRAVRSVRFAES